ncbi:1-acyl-sn-glycerol-3-phosphate acyltransferase [Nitriliruptor alkaliphilus]|uniref:1-acyl-sn-glycerol-3-phosphate acyltransferase n=1 Tax=Nitriliruptor alkaliphilus TaxID=427918 RepID=UPI000696DF38|nr:1-acyl-sn-glycerol-3-phosphate acyltransferase [Nitriliruptor alkaliphilus]
MQTGRGGPLEPAGDGAAEALLAAVREVVADLRREHAVPAVSLDADLEADLGLDSLSVAELLVRTEELFDVALPDEVLVDVRTPHDLLEAAAAASDATAGGSDDVGPPPLRMPTRTPPTVPADGATPPALPDRHDRPTLAARLHGAWTLAAFGVIAALTGLLIVMAPTVALRWRLVRAAGRLLTLLTGIRVRIADAHHLPRARPFVLVANHASHVDPLVLAFLLEEPAVFAAVADIADNPLLRLLLRRMHVHLVGRGDRARGVADAEALTDAVRAGRSVVFFPEGRRSPSRGLEPFRTGAFLVAARSGVPVVPVGIRGTRALLPVGRSLPRRSTVTVTVGPPVTTRQDGWQGAAELHHEARRLILRHSGEPDLV